MTYFNKLIVISFLIFALSGCSLMNKVGHKLVDATEERVQKTQERREQSIKERNGPQNTQGNTGNSTKEVEIKKPAEKQKKADKNFIPAPNLTNYEIDELWGTAINSCIDNSFTITNDNRNSKNLICEKKVRKGIESIYSTTTIYTMIFRFSQKGINISIKGGWDSILAKVKKGMEVKLRELRGNDFAKAREIYDKETVVKIQGKLIELGYDPGVADGIMGTKTTDSLKEFQQKHDLAVTGEPDSATTEKLFQKKQSPQEVEPKAEQFSELSKDTTKESEDPSKKAITSPLDL